MRRGLFASMTMLGLAASGCADPNTTDYDPVGVAAAGANMELAEPEHVTSCVESTKFGAYLGDDAALDRWESAGRSDDALRDACEVLGRNDPDALAAMHATWIELQASID
jgi:hypothetical protein